LDKDGESTYISQTKDYIVDTSLEHDHQWIVCAVVLFFIANAICSSFNVDGIGGAVFVFVEIINSCTVDVILNLD
jgi:hypothetical protein